MSSDRIHKLRDFLKEDPEDTFTRFALALEFVKREELDNARDTFLEIQNHNPDYVGVYYHLGKVYEMLNNPDHALKTYNDGITVARQQQDHHSESELQQAKQELQLEND